MEARDLPPAPLMRVRPARDEDLDRLVAIHAAAFPDARNRDARRRNFTDNARGGLSDLLVAELDGQVTGHAFLYRMATWIAGRQVPVGGVASVGVAPEARGLGVARALMGHIEEELRARGTPLCLLYPFRHRFYRRLGFGTVGEVQRLRVPPSSLPSAPRGLRAEPAHTPDDLAAIRRCYQRIATRSNGMLMRSDAVWRAALTQDGRHVSLVRDDDGEVRGYVVFSYLTAGDGLPQEIDVFELLAEDDRTRLALYGLLRAQRDQVPCVRLVLDSRDPLLSVLEEPRGPYPQSIRSLIAVVGEVGAGAMMQLVDPTAALRTRGWRADGRLSIRIRREGGDDVVLTLDVRGGVPQVDAGGRAPMLTCSAPTLAQIYAGYLRPSDAVRFGAAQADGETARQADRLFDTGGPFVPLDVF